MGAPTLSPALQQSAAPGSLLKSDPGTLRLIAEEKRASGEFGDANACDRAAAALDRMLAPRPTLTSRQRRVFDYILRFIEAYGYSPSFEEIAEHCGYTSLATVAEHLDNLTTKGYVRRVFNQSRSLEVIP